MNCKEFSGMIPSFMNDTLDDASLSAFLEHHHRCAECREELEIQYLVSKAFDQMEEGEEINLSRDLPAYIELERQRLLTRGRLTAAAVVMEILAVAATVVSAFLFFA